MPRDPRLTQRSFFTYWLTERVRWSDTDLVGHVNNLSFSAYFETGRTEFMRPVIDRNKESSLLFVLAQMNTCFLGEVNWPSEVEVGTCMLEIGRSSCRMGQGLFLGEQCVGTADTLLVMIDETTRMPHEIPAYVRQHLESFRAKGA